MAQRGMNTNRRVNLQQDFGEKGSGWFTTFAPISLAQSASPAYFGSDLLFSLARDVVLCAAGSTSVSGADEIVITAALRANRLHRDLKRQPSSADDPYGDHDQRNREPFYMQHTSGALPSKWFTMGTEMRSQGPQQRGITHLDHAETRVSVRQDEIAGLPTQDKQARAAAMLNHMLGERVVAVASLSVQYKRGSVTSGTPGVKLPSHHEIRAFHMGQLFRNNEFAGYRLAFARLLLHAFISLRTYGRHFARNPSLRQSVPSDRDKRSLHYALAFNLVDDDEFVFEPTNFALPFQQGKLAPLTISADRTYEKEGHRAYPHEQFAAMPLPSAQKQTPHVYFEFDNQDFGSGSGFGRAMSEAIIDPMDMLMQSAGLDDVERRLRIESELAGETYAMDAAMSMTRSLGYYTTERDIVDYADENSQLRKGDTGLDALQGPHRGGTALLPIERGAVIRGYCDVTRTWAPEWPVKETLTPGAVFFFYHATRYVYKSRDAYGREVERETPPNQYAGKAWLVMTKSEFTTMIDNTHMDSRLLRALPHKPLQPQLPPQYRGQEAAFLQHHIQVQQRVYRRAIAQGQELPFQYAQDLEHFPYGHYDDDRIIAQCDIHIECGVGMDVSNFVVPTQPEGYHRGLVYEKPAQVLSNPARDRGRIMTTLAHALLLMNASSDYAKVRNRLLDAYDGETVMSRRLARVFDNGERVRFHTNDLYAAVDDNPHDYRIAAETRLARGIYDASAVPVMSLYEMGVRTIENIKEDGMVRPTEQAMHYQTLAQRPVLHLVPLFSDGGSGAFEQFVVSGPHRLPSPYFRHRAADFHRDGTYSGADYFNQTFPLFRHDTIAWPDKAHSPVDLQKVLPALMNRQDEQAIIDYRANPNAPLPSAESRKKSAEALYKRAEAEVSKVFARTRELIPSSSLRDEAIAFATERAGIALELALELIPKRDELTPEEASRMMKDIVLAQSIGHRLPAIALGKRAGVRYRDDRSYGRTAEMLAFAMNRPPSDLPVAQAYFQQRSAWEGPEPLDPLSAHEPITPDEPVPLTTEEKLTTPRMTSLQRLLNVDSASPFKPRPADILVAPPEARVPGLLAEERMVIDDDDDDVVPITPMRAAAPRFTTTTTTTSTIELYPRDSFEAPQVISVVPDWARNAPPAGRTTVRVGPMADRRSSGVTSALGADMLSIQLNDSIEHAQAAEEVSAAPILVGRDAILADNRMQALPTATSTGTLTATASSDALSIDTTGSFSFSADLVEAPGDRAGYNSLRGEIVVAQPSARSPWGVVVGGNEPAAPETITSPLGYSLPPSSIPSSNPHDFARAHGYQRSPAEHGDVRRAAADYSYEQGSPFELRSSIDPSEFAPGGGVVYALDPSQQLLDIGDDDDDDDDYNYMDTSAGARADRTVTTPSTTAARAGAGSALKHVRMNHEVRMDIYSKTNPAAVQAAADSLF